MVNIIITLFLFILLVTQKVLLLNEESLILLCFIMFIVLSSNNLGSVIKDSLQGESSKIEKSLKKSLKNLLGTLTKFSTLRLTLKSLLKTFESFKNYYKNLILTLGALILNYTKYYSILTYTKKLLFLKKIEDQTIKLLITIIIKKLNSIIKTKYFYNSSVKVNQFLSINTIVLRECIRLINSK